MSLCEEFSFGDCTRPTEEFLIESTQTQETEEECQDLGNKVLKGLWTFYTFNKVQSRCSFYKKIKLQAYIDTCNAITGSPDRHTKFCVKPDVNSCNVSIVLK